MVMVDINSNGILVEPMKSRKDAYQALMLRLKRAKIIPKKHVLDNEVSEAMKDLIRDQYQLKLVGRGSRRLPSQYLGSTKCHSHRFCLRTDEWTI